MATHSSILAWKVPWTEEPGESLDKHALKFNWKVHSKTLKTKVQNNKPSLKKKEEKKEKIFDGHIVKLLSRNFA